jgi:hypothetical protein
MTLSPGKWSNASRASHLPHGLELLQTGRMLQRHLFFMRYEIQ